MKPGETAARRNRVTHAVQSNRNFNGRFGRSRGIIGYFLFSKWDPNKITFFQGPQGSSYTRRNTCTRVSRPECERREMLDLRSKYAVQVTTTPVIHTTSSRSQSHAWLSLSSDVATFKRPTVTDRCCYVARSCCCCCCRCCCCLYYYYCLLSR